MISLDLMINIYIQTAYKVKSIYNKLIKILTTFSDYNVHDPATVEQEVKARSNHKKKKKIVSLQYSVVKWQLNELLCFI